MSGLVGNPNCWFSHAMAKIMFNLLSVSKPCFFSGFSNLIQVVLTLPTLPTKTLTGLELCKIYGQMKWPSWNVKER